MAYQRNMDEMIFKKTHEGVRMTHPPPAFKPNKLPRHLAKRHQIRLKYSKAVVKDPPTSQLERTIVEIEGKQRLQLVEWYNEVAQLKKDLLDMEKSLQHSQARTKEKGAKENLQNKKRPFKLPSLSVEELKGMPQHMRPKPNRKLENAKRNRAEINAKSFEVLKFKLTDVRRTRYVKLPDIPAVGEQYRILVTPEQRPELRSIRLTASIAAITGQKPNKEKKRHTDEEQTLITEKPLLSKNHKNDNTMLTAKPKGKETEPRDLLSAVHGFDNSGSNIYLESNQKEPIPALQIVSSPGQPSSGLCEKKKVVIQVKMADDHKRNQQSKGNNRQAHKKAEEGHRATTSLKGKVLKQDDDIPPQGYASQKQRKQPDTKLAPIIERRGQEGEKNTNVRHLRDIDQTEEEYYTNRPEFVTITMEDVKQSRLIRGYDPPEMTMPKDIGNFIFEDNKNKKEDSATSV